MLEVLALFARFKINNEKGTIVAKIAIIYFSKTDVTGQLARAIAAGAEQQGIEQQGGFEILSHRIQGSEIIEGRFVPNLMDELAECDAIIFGSPTYMGSVAAQFKAFADASSESWCYQKWAGKIAAGFTSGGAMNGDQSCTLQYLQTLANQHGMMWLGLDKISNSGAILGSKTLIATVCKVALLLKVVKMVSYLLLISRQPNILANESQC